MEELDLIDIDKHPDISAIRNKIEEIKQAPVKISLYLISSGAVLSLGSVIFALLFSGLSSLIVFSSVICFFSVVIAAFFWAVKMKAVSAKRYLEKPPDAYAKFCLNLYQAISVLNRQILKFNLASIGAIRAGTDNELYSVRQRLKKKIDRVRKILSSLNSVQELFKIQDEQRSFPSPIFVNQADPAMTIPADLDELIQELQQEDEVLASYQELNP